MIKGPDTNRNDTPYWMDLAHGGGVMLRDPTATTPSRARPARRRPLLQALLQPDAGPTLPDFVRSRGADD